MTADNAALVARLDRVVDELADVTVDAVYERVPDVAAIAELNQARDLLVRASNRLHRS